jgi:hypothetical protein
MANSDFWTDAEIISVMIDVIDKFLVPRYKELGMKASGEWEQTLGADRTGMNSAVIKGRFYTEFLTKGRGQNRDQSPEGLRRWAVWAGSTFIKDWVQAKGLAANPIAVAYNIAKNGTSWKRKGGSDLLEVLTEPETINFVNQKLAALARPRIAEQLRRNARDAFRNI